MVRIQKPPPGRLVVSIIYSSIDALADSLRVIEHKFSKVECETIEIPCSSQERYREEMGDNLQRRFFSFEQPVACDTLPMIKATCYKIETMFSDCVRDYYFRTVNIDPGILTPDKLVMASHREYNYRLYLGSGVFAQIELIHSQGQFKRLPWTNLDYCHDEAMDLFYRVRDSFEPTTGQQEPTKLSDIGAIF
ncbi:MAG: hypothetical protein DRP47_00075 [Candidatus Zixiibacteriota bacterium]|nr:MAG: hypothetical protein DRP47_00075 [candidate division Zixibacteria bacterium]